MSSWITDWPDARLVAEQDQDRFQLAGRVGALERRQSHLN